mgnify:CR=1 FL=1
MGAILTNHDTATGAIARLMDRFGIGLSQTLRNIKAQQDSWQRFHQTPSGRHISRRAWMRHGAMLQQMSGRDGPEPAFLTRRRKNLIKHWYFGGS